VGSSTGDFNHHGYAADLKLGYVFVLANTITSASSVLPTKAPPKPSGGYGLGLDVSGHVGYSSTQTDGFTDSAGLDFGTGKNHFGDGGASAKLFAYVPCNGLIWVPYVTGTVDREFNFSNTFNIPDQVMFPGGDLFVFTQSQTYWGAQLGLDAKGANGWTVGVKGFYSTSSDTNFVGGSAYIKIPFDGMPFVAARY
jgi:hypothetical protein